MEFRAKPSICPNTSSCCPETGLTVNVCDQALSKDQFKIGNKKANSALGDGLQGKEETSKGRIIAQLSNTWLAFSPRPPFCFNPTARKQQCNTELDDRSVARIRSVCSFFRWRHASKGSTWLLWAMWQGTENVSPVSSKLVDMPSSSASFFF